MAPIERFVHVEASSGIVLLVVALLALFAANSPWAGAFEGIWHTPVLFGIGPWRYEVDFHFVVNDILMVIFFFVVGLEIRREIADGELSELRRATLPILAAIGGMVVPAGLYLLLNASSPRTIGGWGVPMATDIAFAVGILSLLGDRVPAALRVLLLALAIIDDIGAIIIIAAFYSSGIDVASFAVVALGVAAIFALQRLGVRQSYAYIPAGVVVWFGVLRAGVHPTIAGALIGLLTPAHAWYGGHGFVQEAERSLREFEARARRGEHPEALLEPLDRLKDARREALSPAVRLQLRLHPWVAFGVMPLFALANAGVSLGGMDFGAEGAWPLALGIGFGLVVGKPLGVLALSFFGVRLGFCSLPGGVNWIGMGVVGLAAGIGFTMSLFIAALAFTDAEQLATAKLAVLGASGVAGLAALAVGRFAVLGDEAECARSLREAETSSAL